MHREGVSLLRPGLVLASLALVLLACSRSSTIGQRSVAPMRSVTPPPSSAPRPVVPEPSEFLEAKSRCVSLSAPVVGGSLVRANGEVYVPTSDGYVHSFSPSLEHRFSFSLEGVPVGIVEVGEGVLVATSARMFTSIHSKGAERYHFRSHASPQFGLGIDDESNLYFVGSDRFVYSVTSRGVARFRVEMPSEPAGPPMVVGSGDVWVPLRRGLAHLNSARSPDLVPLDGVPEKIGVGLGSLWFSRGTSLVRVTRVGKSENFADVATWDVSASRAIFSRGSVFRWLDRDGEEGSFDCSTDADVVFATAGAPLVSQGRWLRRIGLRGEILSEHTLPDEVLEAKSAAGFTFALTRDGALCAWPD